MFKNNVIANFLGKVWPSLLGLILVPIYLHYLGIEAYGLVGFFVALQGLIGFLDMGLSTASVREVARERSLGESVVRLPDLLRTFEVVYWGVAALIGVGFLLSSDWLATEWIVSQSLPTDLIRLAAIIFGVTLALRWPVALYSGVLRGLEKQVLLNVVAAILATLRNVGAALMVVFVSRSILLFLLWQLGAALVEIIVMFLLAWRLLPRQSGRAPAFHFEILKRVGRFGVSLTIISILASIFKQFDRVAITRLLSLEAVGYYVAAYTIYELLSYFVTPVVDAAFPRFSSLLSQGNTESLADMYHNTAQIVSFFVAPATAFVSLFSYDILLIWTRSPEVAQNAHQTLSILALAYGFNAMMHIPVMLQYAAGMTSIAMGVNVLGSLFLLPFMYLVIERFGIAGAGITWLIFNLLYYLIAPHVMHRRILPGHQTKWIFKDTLSFLLLAWALMGGAYVLGLNFGYRILVLLGVLMSFLIYAILCLWNYPVIRSLLPRTAERWFLSLNKRESVS
jgi:O-antigen/teichoic acid export membrane protein